MDEQKTRWSGFDHGFDQSGQRNQAPRCFQDHKRKKIDQKRRITGEGGANNIQQDIKNILLRCELKKI